MFTGDVYLQCSTTTTTTTTKPPASTYDKEAKIASLAFKPVLRLCKCMNGINAVKSNNFGRRCDVGDVDDVGEVGGEVGEDKAALVLVEGCLLKKNCSKVGSNSILILDNPQVQQQKNNKNKVCLQHGQYCWPIAPQPCPNRAPNRVLHELTKFLPTDPLNWFAFDNWLCAHRWPWYWTIDGHTGLPCKRVLND